MPELTMRQMQALVDELVVGHQNGYWEPLSILARIVEEVGETSRVVNQQFGQKPCKPGENPRRLGEELADILYTIICLANREGIDLETEFRGVLLKYRERDQSLYET